MKPPWRRLLDGSTPRSWLKAEPIYVEIRIRAPLDELWRRTQTPYLHARWDLRFTEIDYLPRTEPDGPQRFRYTTRIGPLTIAGEGVTVGNQQRPDSRTSALEFGTDDRASLIAHGSGYWQYIQTDDGVRFLTQYSYEPRWGLAGDCIDRLLFRRLLGWATAWSFDRLRLWLEHDRDPAAALRDSVIHAAARSSLAALVALLAGGALVRRPTASRAPFNPAALTVAAVAFAIVAHQTARDLPTARTCLRTRPRRVT